jgi:hypothetical protein
MPEAPVTITVADRLPALLAARLSDDAAKVLPRVGKKEREAIAAFYALGGYKALWVKDGAWTPAAVALRDRLARAGREQAERRFGLADRYDQVAVVYAAVTRQTRSRAT